MGKAKKDAAQTKLLQSLAREFVSDVPHPPDAAAQAMGRQLALDCWKSGTAPSQAVYDALTQPNLHPSVPMVFFQTYAEKIKSKEESGEVAFLDSWSVQLDELLSSDGNSIPTRELLDVCIQTFVLSLKDEDMNKGLLEFYQKLRDASSRRFLWQASLTRANLWKPLFVATVLDLTKDVNEQQFCIRSTLRYIWALVDSDTQRALDVSSWFVKCLERLVAGLTNLGRSEAVARLELAAASLLDILEIGQILSSEEIPELNFCTRLIVGEILLPLSLNGLPSQQIAAICKALLPLVRDLELDIVTVFKLVVLSMVTNQPGPTRDLLNAAVCDQHHSHSMISALATIHDDADLRQLAPLSEFTEPETFHAFQCVRFAEDPLVNALLDCSDFSCAKTSAVQQIAVLYFGLTLMDNDDYREKARSFLTSLVESCPHLGRQVLPVVLRDIGAESDPAKLVAELEFLCTLVKDPHCAQPVWKMIGGTLSDPHAPLSTRVAMTRVLPKLVDQNKRLYRRVIDILGAGLTESPELRLATAATLYDLAKLDLIRDVSDVIGWIQTLLTEQRSDPLQHLLIHYACMCLHALVQSQELEFAVVLQVVGKKLVGMTAPDLLRLPLVIVEAIVLLLGDGECETTSSEEDADSDTVVSPQTTRAVDALVAIGLSLGESSIEDIGDAELPSRQRVLRNVYRSLSLYSQEALGLDYDGVKAVAAANADDDVETTIPSSGERYVSLIRLVLQGLDNDELMEDLSTEQVNPVVILARKILRLEEDSIGAALWNKHGRNPGRSRKLPSRALLACLPSKKFLDESYSGDSSVAVSIASMVSLDLPDINVLRDNADASIESTDPMFLSFAVQGFLQVASLLVSADSLQVKDVISEIKGWSEVFVSADSMYLSLAALSVYINPEMRPDKVTCPYVEDIHDLVLRAHKDQMFEKEDVSKISLGLIGVSAYRRGAVDALDDIISRLEQSVRGYGGQRDFGAYYGLSLICQSMGLHERSPIDEQDVHTKICRINGFLVEELLSCFDDSDDFFDDLVTSIKAGSVSDTVTDRIKEVGNSSVALLMTKHVVARYLFISCALSLPVLATVGSKLLVAVLYALETLEWGSGKGISLPTVLHTCEHLKLLRLDELDMIYGEYASVFDARMDNDEADLVGDGLDDIFYAVNRTANRPTPHIVRELLVGNQELFDDDGCVLSLVAAVAKVCEFPCLGAVSFAFSPKLDTNAALSDLKSIVKVVTEAVDLGDESKYSGMGIILLGILSSLRTLEEKSAISELMPKDKVGLGSVVKPSSYPVSECPDFAKLPSSHKGTLLFGLMDFLEGVYGGAPVTDSESYLGRAVTSALEAVSLPKQFATLFLAPMLQSIGVETSKTCVQLLLSQITSRRKAAFDGREFIGIASRLLSASSPDEVLSLFGDARMYRVFLQQLPSFASKYPNSSLEEIVPQTWKACHSMVVDIHQSISSFLIGMKGVLSSTALAPRDTKFVGNFLLNKVAFDLADIDFELLLRSLDTPQDSILNHYVSCVEEISLSSLDESGFFDLPRNRDDEFRNQCFTVLCTLRLLRTKAVFNGLRSAAELNSVSSWLASKLCLEAGDVDAIRRVMCVYASTCNILRPTEKSNQLAALFEILLMTDGQQMGIELLAVSVAFWCQHRGSDCELSLSVLFGTDGALVAGLPSEGLQNYYQMILGDLAENIGAFSRREKASIVVFNLLHRLHAKWDAKGVNSDTLLWLSRSLCHCRSGLGNEDNYACHTIESFLSADQSTW